MPDLPDWYQGFQLVGSDITINVNIEAAGVTLPISIAAADVTLDVSIVAQVGNISFVFADQSVAVFDAAKWFAHQAAQVFINAFAAAAPRTWAVIISRVVPDATTFFVNGLGYGIDGGPGLLAIMAELRVDAATLMTVAFTPGGGLTFDVPIRATAGQTVEMRAFHVGGTDPSTIYASYWGYDEED